VPLVLAADASYFVVVICPLAFRMLFLFWVYCSYESLPSGSEALNELP
jgi:hypothetical protein